MQLKLSSQDCDTKPQKLLPSRTPRAPLNALTSLLAQGSAKHPSKDHAAHMKASPGSADSAGGAGNRWEGHRSEWVQRQSLPSPWQPCIFSVHTTVCSTSHSAAHFAACNPLHGNVFYSPFTGAPYTVSISQALPETSSLQETGQLLDLWHFP